MSRTKCRSLKSPLVVVPLVVVSGWLAETVQAVDSDFNGDGFTDLAVGIPKEDVGAGVNAGAICIIYGSAAGLVSANNQFFTLASVGLSADAGDKFGTVITSGDFNNDGFEDLAIGIPGADPSDQANAGSVIILFGSAGGLTTVGFERWAEDSPGIVGNPEPGDHFGAALASGDFDNDGLDDLAIGIPGKMVNGHAKAGALAIIYGSMITGNDSHNEVFTQGAGGVGETAEDGDKFGSVLTDGDFNNDGFDDLAIGVPNEGLGSKVDAGVVHVIYGSVTGLDTSGSQVWTLTNCMVGQISKAGDKFGAALAASRYSGDGFDDLAIGIPGRDVGGKIDAGAVVVLYGPLTTTGSQFWTQDSMGIVDSAEAGDRFGSSLADGDFNLDGIDDLIIGIPNETVNGFAKTGAVQIMYGSASGLSATGNQFWHEGNAMLGPQAAGDLFGKAVADGDYNGDGVKDIAVGAPGKAIGGKSGAGAVFVLYGVEDDGIAAAGGQMWTQNSTGIHDSCEVGDGFGTAIEP